MDDLPSIALLTDSSAKETRWRELLSRVPGRISLGTDLAANNLSFDIVITDCQLDAFPIPPARSHEFGVIGIGSAVAADVLLPDEPTERELQLACGLLYEIVQLRRERAASQQSQRLLAAMAESDALTGLPNRRAWDAELARWTQHDNEVESAVCVALFDVDHFKAVNTLHGYPAADKVLQNVGAALQAGIRANDFVARLGGDEFGVLLTEVSAEHAEAVVERIRAGIALSLQASGVTAVTATAGLAFSRNRLDAESLFADADANLRRGKSAGRNRTVASS